MNACPNNCIKFGTVKEKQPFSPKRRNFIMSISALALFGVAYNCKEMFDDNSQTAKILKNRCKKCGMCAVKCPYGAIGFTRGEFPIRL
ncbi:MAG: 4Fe-4S binding protein [Brachyspira sp.]|nr:4Fe-4S binding protein [Brachyspira sp.]